MYSYLGAESLGAQHPFRVGWDATGRSLRRIAPHGREALARQMTSYSEPSPEQETVGGGAESVPEPVDPRTEDPRELGGDDTVEASDELSNEEVER